MRVPALLSCWLALAGCGSTPPDKDGESQPRAHTTARQPAPASDSRPVIVAFGDSISAGFGVDPGNSYPDFLQALLDAQGYRYRVVNAGISGDTTTDGLARLHTVLAMKPEIVIVEFGGNDGLRGIPVAIIRNNLSQMVTQLQSAGIQVVLAAMTLPRNYGADYIRSFESIYSELAAKHKVSLVPLVMSVGENGRYMQRDGLHPNVEGNRRLAQAVFKALQAELRKRPQ